MKKTTTIHLSGVLFNIEEEAYEKLSQYLKSIENHFSENPGKKEILEDIENRIAELFSEKLNLTKKQVITLDDVNEIISILGHAEQFDDHKEQETYTSTGSAKKRFYRNPDDKVLGGVCGGIAAYFDIDPLWIRLAWAILFFVFGTGILFYILLWIIIPEAKTSSQKLEMRGEKINISNISKGISDDLNRLGKSASKEFSNVSSNKLVTFIQNIFQYLLNFIESTGKVILKFFALFFIFVFAFILFLLLAMMFSDSYVSIYSTHFTTSSMLSDFFVSPFVSFLFLLSLFFLIGVPLIVLISSLIKFIFNIKRKIKYMGITALILWIIGWLLLFYSATHSIKNFSEKAFHTTQFTQYILPNKTIYIKMMEDDEYKDEDGLKIRVANKFLFSSNQNDASIGFPSVIIKKSKDDSLRIKIIQSALAGNKTDAKQLSKNINYEFNINDSIIQLANKYNIPKEDKFHFQRVKIIIEIPQNRTIYLSKNLEYYLSEAENNIDADEEDMVGKTWKMGMEHLQCLEQCDEISNIKKEHHNKNKKHQDEDADEY